MSFSRIPTALASIATFSLLTGVLSLSGCGMATSTAGTSASSHVQAAAAGGIGGNVHGGNQPITGASITLWAAGVTGTGASNYGANATSVATTTSDSNGNFSFNNPTTGASPCTTGQYLYITATGGNPGLTGTVNNASIALMAAFPQPCGASTAGTFVTVNEVTTVASVWALQQFMTISSGATPWMIGAPSTNVTGLANAFTEVGTLANITTGVSGATTVTNTVNSVVYSTLIAPDSTKINTLADILATCVNTTGPCTQFFSDVTPSGKSSPTDTLQAAWYIARNAGGLTMANGSGGGSPYYLCNTYVAGAGTPFVPAETCAVATSTTPPVPNDWTIQESWKTTTPGGTTGTVYANSVAIDANGNIWTAPYSGATGVNAFNPAGQALITPVTTVNVPSYSLGTVIASTTTTSTVTAVSGYALSTAKAFGVAIDTLGNAWAESTGGVTAGTYGTLNTGVLAEVAPSGSATGYIVSQSPNTIAIDGNNNIYMSGSPVTSRYYVSEMQAPYNNGGGLGTGTVTETLTEGLLRNTGYYTQLAVDESPTQYVWATYLSCSTSTNRLTSALETSQVTPTPVVTGITCPLAVTIDAANNAWMTSAGSLYYVNISTGVATPTVTTFTGSTNAVVNGTPGFAGLDNAGAIAIDGLGNVWVAGKGPSTYNGFAVLAPTTTGTTTTAVALSPSGQGQFGFEIAAGNSAGVTAPVIDGSGNVWAATNSGSYLYHLVGAAAPVVTPISVAIKNGTLATLP